MLFKLRILRYLYVKMSNLTVQDQEEVVNLLKFLNSNENDVFEEEVEEVAWHSASNLKFLSSIEEKL